MAKAGDNSIAGDLLRSFIERIERDAGGYAARRGSAAGCREVSVVDWESKPEPWRSMGLKWVEECRAATWRVPAGLNLKRKTRTPTESAIRIRRTALGLSGLDLDRAANVFHGATSQHETNHAHFRGGVYRKIIATLDRLEADRAENMD